MFTLVATDPVRIFIDVPQSVAPSVRVGTDAAITVREFGGRAFAGKVTRSAGALDPELHVMSTEIQVPNADSALLPGMYVTVAISLPVPHRVVEVPSTALYSDAQGLRVATVDAQARVKFVPITIERDTGPTLWIATGLTGDERIVKIAVPTLLDGDQVEVAVPPPPPPGAGSGSSAGSGAHK
jgi:RND family efflux transporter MFP subunit